ncbi:uncharacterized protein HKW66_Vig0040270 [Vigna angularis]|uniref:Transposase MuDR plant domain-containing protein n=1 Tax=Phaseolus angularis TaxID=3914 RepID=A0A8T0LGL3_PHAAN|nr:uncharacterized protein HKW66_Vig0040270 [Vigna angularis]
MDDIEVVIHHGGKFVNDGCLKYEGESAMHMVNLAHLNEQVHLYVVHTISQPDVIHMIEYNVDEGGEEVAPQVNEGGEVAQFAEGVDDGLRKVLDEGVGGDGERIKAQVVSHTEMTEAAEDEGERIEVDEGDVERTEADVDEDGYGHFSTFTMPKKMIDFNWEVGTYFVHKQDILDAIKSYAVDNGKNLKLVKNDKKRIRVKCLGSKGECPWRAYFGFMDAVKSWQLMTVVDKHTCSREHKLRVFNAKWLSRKLEKTLRENPNVKGVDIRDKITRKWNIAISKNMAYRVKAYASDEGSGPQQKKLPQDKPGAGRGITTKLLPEGEADGQEPLLS